MKEPSKGPNVRMESHHAPGVEPPKAASFANQFSVKRRIGLELAIAIITTTKTGSAAFKLVTYPTSAGHPFIRTAAIKSGTNQMPKTASTSPMK